MQEKKASIPTINCGHCVATIKNELSYIDGVEAVEGDPATKTVTVQWNDPASWDIIKKTLTEIGFPPENE